MSSTVSKYYAEVINTLHENWEPHDAQVEIGRSFFTKGIKYVFAECGRNFGKTELVTYLHSRWSMMNPGSENYFFAPYSKQAREIVWESKRYEKMIPSHWIEKIDNQGMRITLVNGSFIKLDGSDNTEIYRGVKPRGLIVLDEFKDFKPEFWDAFEPNTLYCSVFIVGTPPPAEEEDHQFFMVADEWADADDKKYFNFPTRCNPHVPENWLEGKKRAAYLRGEGYKYEREYEAKRVKGGAKKIFPMLSDKIVKPHNDVMSNIARDRKKLHWFLWADPAAASCFAVLFLALNPYTKDLYALDEIYETDQRKMSARQIGKRIFKTRDELYNLAEWRQGYDEAATWWLNEMLDSFGEHFEPTMKSSSSKENGISLIKDILIGNKLTISDRCSNFYWELDNYSKDTKGNIKKENDHLIDDFRYILTAAGYHFEPIFETSESDDPDFRGAKISDDFPHIEDDLSGFNDELIFNEEYDAWDPSW